MLFEGDLHGLGNPEGWSKDLDTIIEYSKKVFNVVTWFNGDELLDLEAAEKYFSDQDEYGDNCLWLSGESGQECAIFRMFEIKTGQTPIIE